MLLSILFIMKLHFTLFLIILLFKNSLLISYCIFISFRHSVILCMCIYMYTLNNFIIWWLVKFQCMFQSLQNYCLYFSQVIILFYLCQWDMQLCKEIHQRPQKLFHCILCFLIRNTFPISNINPSSSASSCCGLGRNKIWLSFSLSF